MVVGVQENIEVNREEYQSEDGLKDSGYLPLRVRRRYAKVKAVFEVGVWAVKSIDLLFGIMIGSKADVRNSYVELREDNRDLRKALAKMGLEYADCFCGELSPESHEFRKRDGSIGVTVGNLWHLHGFFRFNELIKAADLHSVLSPLWGKIHGSDVVDVKILTDIAKVIKYSVKDAVKHYCSEDHARKRLFMSRDWLPKGYREVDKVLNHWALLHRYNWDEEESMPDQGYGPRLDYIPFVWEQKRDYVRRWCCGEKLWLDMGDYRAFIDGAKIYKTDGVKSI